MYLFSKSQVAYALSSHGAHMHSGLTRVFCPGPRNSWRGTEYYWFTNHLFLDFITSTIPQFNYNNNLYLCILNINKLGL